MKPLLAWLVSLGVAGIAKIGGIPAIRSAADTEKYLREQFELYEKLVIAPGIRQ